MNEKIPKIIEPKGENKVKSAWGNLAKSIMEEGKIVKPGKKIVSQIKESKKIETAGDKTREAGEAEPIEGEKIEEINFKEIPECEKVRQIYLEIYYLNLSSELSADKKKKYEERSNNIIAERIVAENLEDAKEKFEDEIIRLEEIKKEIEGEINKQIEAEAPENIEQKKSTEQIIDNDIRTMLNTAKIRIEDADNPEEMEKKLEQAVFAQSEGVRENQEIMERINDIIEQISKEDKVKADETRMLGLVKSVSKITGIKKEKIIQIIKNQENRIKEKAEQELYSGSFKKKLAIAGVRWGAYVGIGVGVGALTVATSGIAGIFGGSALAGVRMAEGAITAKISGKKLKKIESELKKQLKENQAEKNKFLTDIIAEIALNKQEEIDHRDEEKQEAKNNLEEKREAYLKKGKKLPETEEYQEYSEALNCLKENYKKSLNDYLDERYPDIDPKEKEACVSAMLALFQNEENTELLKQEFFKKGLFKKGIDKIQKVLDSKWLGGKDTVEKKLRTAAVFAGAGFLARQSNTVKRILFTFAGAKAGSATVDLIIKNTKAFNILNKISAKDLTEQEEISDDLFNRAKAQLMDDNFRKENQSEYAKLREEVERIEKEKILKAEKAEQLIEKNNEKLRNKILEKKQAEENIRRTKIAAQVIGAGAGFAFGELFVHSAQAKNIDGEADKQIETKGGVNATDDNETEVDKEQKLGEILEEEKEIPKTEQASDVVMTTGQKLENNLSIFCKKNDINLEDDKKLTNEQGAKFLKDNLNYGVDNIKSVLKDHVEDWYKVERIQIESAVYSGSENSQSGEDKNIPNSKTSDNETIENKSEVATKIIKEGSTENENETPNQEAGEKTQVAEPEEVRGLKNSFTLKLGQDKIPAQLERVFHMMSVDSIKGMENNEIFGEDEGAKSLNVAANLVKLAEGENILGINANEFKKVIEWNVDTNELIIKDHAKFNEIVGELNAHAQKLWNDEILQKEAVAYLDDIEKNTWEDIIKANGLEEQVEGHDEITSDKIMDFKDSEMVKKANKIIEEAQETVAVETQQSAKAAAPEISGETDEICITNLEDFKKMNISEQKKIMDDLHNQSREVDKITDASENAKDNLRKERAEANTLKTKFIRIFNEQHQTEIKEYKNLGAEITELETKAEAEVSKNLEKTGKEIYRKSIIGRIFGADWDEPKWEKAKESNMSEVLDGKHKNIANEKLLSHLSDTQKSFRNPSERETVEKYLERFEAEKAEEKLGLYDKKVKFEKLGKMVEYGNIKSEETVGINNKKIDVDTNKKSPMQILDTR